MNISNVLMKQIDGPLGFGSIAAVVVNGLLPNTDYGFAVQHECTANRKVYSSPRNISTKTLGEGKIFWVM